MEIAYNAMNLEIRPAERTMIEEELARLDGVLSKFPRPVAHLGIEKSPRKGGYGVSLHVRLSTRPLFATAWGGNLRGAVELATDKLVRQAKRHLDVLRKEERAGANTVRNSYASRLPTAAELASIRDLEEFRDQAAHHVARLNDVLNRERRLDPRAKAAGGRISVPDIVEEALVYVFEHFHEKPAEMSPDRWLVRRGLLLFEQELERVAGITSATDAPRSAAPVQEDWEELMDLPLLRFRPLESRPDEDARASPEALGIRGKAQTETAAALKELPDRQRRTLLLRHLEGYDLPEIAYVLNAGEDQVEEWLLLAETTLQERLKDWRPV
jgi:RNA polymerase sigma-70 factor (ECF subfamily)